MSERSLTVDVANILGLSRDYALGNEQVENLHATLAYSLAREFERAKVRGFDREDFLARARVPVPAAPLRDPGPALDVDTFRAQRCGSDLGRAVREALERCVSVIEDLPYPEGRGALKQAEDALKGGTP